MVLENQWSQEVAELGADKALLERLEFHGYVEIDEAVRQTGLCYNTVRKHMRRLVAHGHARIEVPDCRWRRT